MASPSPQDSLQTGHRVALLICFFLSAAFLLQPLYLPKSVVRSAEDKPQFSSFAERAAVNQVARIAMGARKLTDETDAAGSMMGPLKDSIREGQREEDKQDVLLMRLALYDALGMDEDAQALRSLIKQQAGPSPPDGEAPAEVRESLAALDHLEQLYMEGEPLDAPATDRVVSAFGFTGRLARVHNLQLQNDDEAESRLRRLENEAVRYMIGFVIFVALVLFLLGAGVLLLIVASIRYQNGDLKSGFGRTALPPWLNLESFTAFLMLMIGGSLLSEQIGRPEAFPLLPSLVLQLGLLAVIAYPKIYGASWSAIRKDLGLAQGTGTLREFVLGPVGYVAALPLVAVGVVLTLLIVRLTGMDMNQGMHPIVPMVKGENASPLTAIMALLLAVVLAPVAEEITFRGFFYNALRSRFTAAVSIALSSAFFAGIHPQGIIGFPMLMAIGIMLAALREWRGSLIAPIVAHACVNGVTMIVVLLGY